MKNLYIYIQIILTTISFLNLNYTQVAGQGCISVCSSTTSTISSPLSITGTTTWSSGGASGNCVLVSDVVTISGTLTISAVDCKMDDDGRFVVNNGGTLRIISGSEIYAYNSSWGTGTNGGIRVKGGGTLDMDDASTGTVIAQAKVAIFADADANGEALLQIHGAEFCNNEIAIKIGPRSGTMASYINDCEFYAPAFPAPGGSEVGDYGIQVLQVHPGGGDQFLIGTDDPYDGALTDYNEFHDINVGIMSFKSEVAIDNNYIHDLLGGYSTLDLADDNIYQTGIYALGANTSTQSLKVGLAYYTDEVNNKIENARIGIFVDGYVYTQIWENTITSDYNDGEYSMDLGIGVTGNCTNIDLADNTVENFHLRGISVMNNAADDDIWFTANYVHETGDYTTGHPIGIYLANNSATDISLFGNALNSIQEGIFVENSDDVNLNDNGVYFEAHDDVLSSDIAYGLEMSGCDGANVISNYFIGNRAAAGGSFKEFIIGISVDNCTTFTLDENWIDDAGYGIYDLETSTDGILTCNGINACDVGIYLNAIGGGMGDPPIYYQQGALGIASDNYWLEAGVENTITTNDPVNCNDVEWYYNDASGYDVTCCTDPDVATTMPGFTLTDGGSCTATYDPMRLIYEDPLEALEIDFYDWAILYNEDEIEPSPVSWFRLYEFWNRILVDDINVNELSEPLQDLYLSISNSNIPLIDGLVASLGARDYAGSQEILNAITPVNDIEYYWQLASQIFINNIDTTGVFELSEQDRPSVREIAILDGINGPGVFKARAMMDTVIHHMDVKSEEKMFREFPNLIQISPNPAQNYITLISADIESMIIKIENIEMFDASGTRVKYFDKILSPNLYLGDIANGVYLIKINLKDNSVCSDKIIILK